MINFGFLFEDFRGAEFSKNSLLMRDLQMFPSAPSIYCFIEQNRVVKKKHTYRRFLERGDEVECLTAKHY